MTMRPVVLAAVVLAFLSVFFGCDGSSSNPDAGTIISLTVSVNGVFTGGTVNVRKTDQGCVADVRALVANIAGLEFFPMINPPNKGMVLYYGKRFSFVSVGFDTGFCGLVKTPMKPPLAMEGETYWAPLNFLAGSVSGDMAVDESAAVLAVTCPQPAAIGDIVPQAKPIAQELSKNFIVRQGGISVIHPIEIFVAGYSPNCNGNNADNPYLMIQNPISPRTDSYYRLPFMLQMDQDEAVVWVAYTPPACKYFSYQHFLMTRFFPNEPVLLKKIYARLGDSINAYNIPLRADPFKKFYVFIITGNQDTHDTIKNAILNAGIAEDRILSIVIPTKVVRFGNVITADALNFLHRAVLFDRDADKNAYVSSPTLEVLRLTPKAAIAANPIPRPAGRVRQTGVREQDIPGLGDLLKRLQTEIMTAHGGRYVYTKLLTTSTWMYPGGDQAIADGEDVLGETNDTLYLKTKPFTLHNDDLIVVFGPNHDKTGKSVYSNVSCYGLADNGVGGIASTPWTPDAPGRRSYFGTAAKYLPDVSRDKQEMFYVYKFARRPIDESTFILPYNNGDYMGFNDGETVFMGYRMYVNPDTTIGAYPGQVRDWDFFPIEGPSDSEVFFDQTILFTNTPP